jgi:hypothetical protein
MGFLVYSQLVGDHMISVLGCVSSLEVANEILKKKVREYIAFHEGEKKNQISCRPSVSEITGNKELKEGLYYVCSKNKIEIYKKTNTTLAGWVYNSLSSEAQMLSYYVIIEVNKSIIDMSPRVDTHDKMMSELKQQLKNKALRLATNPTVEQVPLP